MNIITLEEIKAHCRIDSTVEDKVLELYGDSAEETVLALIDRSVDELYELWGKIPVNVKHACLMLVDHSYAHHAPAEPTKLYDVPYTIDALLKPYWKL